VNAWNAQCKTDAERILAFLWSVRATWIPEHELQGRETPFGFIGSAGHTRARELARDDCADRLKGKIERARGGEIGLDRRFVYFRYRARRELTPAERCRLFDAGATSE
jgi:hypothetical protein